MMQKTQSACSASAIIQPTTRTPYQRNGLDLRAASLDWIEIFISSSNSNRA